MKKRLKYIEIISTDNTNVFIRIKNIKYVIQTNDGCKIGLDNGDMINTTANFYDITKAIKGGAE